MVITPSCEGRDHETAKISDVGSVSGEGIGGVSHHFNKQKNAEEARM